MNSDLMRMDSDLTLNSTHPSTPPLNRQALNPGPLKDCRKWTGSVGQMAIWYRREDAGFRGGSIVKSRVSLVGSL